MGSDASCCPSSTRVFEWTCRKTQEQDEMKKIERLSRVFGRASHTTPVGAPQLSQMIAESSKPAPRWLMRPRSWTDGCRVGSLRGASDVRPHTDQVPIECNIPQGTLGHDAVALLLWLRLKLPKTKPDAMGERPAAAKASIVNNPLYNKEGSGGHFDPPGMVLRMRSSIPADAEDCSRMPKLLARGYRG